MQGEKPARCPHCLALAAGRQGAHLSPRLAPWLAERLDGDRRSRAGGGRDPASGCPAARATSAAAPAAHPPLRRPRPPLLSPPPPPRGTARPAPRGVVTCSAGASGARTRAAAPPGFALDRRPPPGTRRRVLAPAGKGARGTAPLPGGAQTAGAGQGKGLGLVNALPSQHCRGWLEGPLNAWGSEVAVGGSQGSSRGVRARDHQSPPRRGQSWPLVNWVSRRLMRATWIPEGVYHYPQHRPRPRRRGPTVRESTGTPESQAS